MPVNGTYLTQVKRLHASIVRMGEFSERLLGDSIAALVSKDWNLANEVLERDDSLDRMEDEHEEWTIQMMALNQPVARDLRLLIAFLRINQSIERVGDLAVNIAQSAIRIKDQPRLQPFVDIPHNYELTRVMLVDALSAFANEDDKLAADIRARDEEADRANRETITQLINIGKSTPDSLFVVTNLIGVSKALERSADLAVDIADEVIYVSSGELRHARQNQKTA